MSKLKNISFGFVPMGTVAPSQVDPNEIWLDVGNRAAGRVMDHHGGDTRAWSAVQLLLDNSDQIRSELLKDVSSITLVTHQSPDLDAISAAWLTQKILAGDSIDDERAWIDPIVDAVSLNDQGMVRTDQPERCWPIVMRLLIAEELSELKDPERLRAGIQLLERTFALVKAGNSLSAAAQQLVTATVFKLLDQANNDYERDRTRGKTFHVRLPLSLTGKTPKAIPTMQKEKNPSSIVQWSLTDAIVLNNPKSALFRELARGDIQHSSMGKGFQLLVVTHNLADIEASSPYCYRYIISTDPLSGLHLQGLGGELESCEQEKEDQLGIDLPKGRNRLGEKKGRFGTNVESPWYDGSGHNFTIIDSPVVRINGKDRCASCLTTQNVLEVIRRYGDSAVAKTK